MLRPNALLKFILLVSIIGSGLVNVAARPAPDSVPAPDFAQQNCGVIENSDDLGMPVDVERFRLVQPFGRPNGRYDGKLHAGEDWISREGDTYGQPVYAIGPGMVTFADPTAWGRDKGVVIVLHTFADGSTMFSFYGHMEEIDNITFAEQSNCVQKGDVVGAIGDPRPAPHLHFEVRSFLGNAPGPGYWEVDPRLRGWQHPRQFITNWQAWLHPAHVWHWTLDNFQGPALPNIMREDGVVILLDGNLLRAYSPQGRIWQYRLPDSLDPIGFQTLDTEMLAITSRDGRLQYWNQYGGFVRDWHTGLSELAQGAIFFSDLTLLRTPDDMLMIYNGNNNLVRRYADIPEIQAVARSGGMLALITAEPHLLLMNADGEIFERQEISRASDIVAHPTTPGFYLRDGDTLYFLGTDAERSEPILEELSVNRSDRAMLVASNGWLVMWGINGRARLMAVDPTGGEVVWETDIEDVEPNLLRAQLVQADACNLALADRRGRIFTFQLEDGTSGQPITVWGDHMNDVWLSGYPGDNILRVHIADQLIGLSLDILTGQTCS